MSTDPEPRMMKVMPVVLRRSAGHTEILVFRHPVAGIQLVKGTLEQGESVESAAVRELREESGVAASSTAVLGEWWNHAAEQWWVSVAVQPVGTLPDEWSHETADDGGRRFEFFWHRLAAAPSEEWHPRFREALEHVRRSGADLGQRPV